MPKAARRAEPELELAADRLLIPKAASCQMCWKKHTGEGRYCSPECEARTARPGGPMDRPYSNSKRPRSKGGQFA